MKYFCLELSNEKRNNSLRIHSTLKNWFFFRTTTLYVFTPYTLWPYIWYSKSSIDFAEGGGGGGRKSGARKGQFAKSKGHHGRGGQNENQEHLNMDPEYRTHMLFPGKMIACMITQFPSKPNLFCRYPRYRGWWNVNGWKSFWISLFYEKCFRSRLGSQGNSGVASRSAGPNWPKISNLTRAVGSLPTWSQTGTFSPPKKREIFWRMSCVT